MAPAGMNEAAMKVGQEGDSNEIIYPLSQLLNLRNNLSYWSQYPGGSTEVKLSYEDKNNPSSRIRLGELGVTEDYVIIVIHLCNQWQTIHI